MHIRQTLRAQLSIADWQKTPVLEIGQKKNKSVHFHMSHCHTKMRKNLRKIEFRALKDMEKMQKMHGISRLPRFSSRLVVGSAGIQIKAEAAEIFQVTISISDSRRNRAGQIFPSSRNLHPEEDQQGQNKTTKNHHHDPMYIDKI